MYAFTCTFSNVKLNLSKSYETYFISFAAFVQYSASECFFIVAEEKMPSLKGPDLTVILSKPWRETPLWNEQVTPQINEFKVVNRTFVLNVFK